MGIEDIQISEELETNAPSIKYRGNEGPKSPQEEQMIMLIQKLMSQGLGQEEAMQMAQQMMAEAEQQQMAQQQMPQQQMPRQMAAFGGIMGVDGRRQYGLGSKFKKFVRKIIPNEVAEIAVKAAPFVAPFNPLAAGLMSGIGSFDKTGRIGSSLKAGLMNYGMGQGARYLGGAGFQTGINPMTGSGVQGAGFFSKPTGSGGIKNLFKSKIDPTAGNSLGLGGSNPSGIAGNTSNISLAGDSGSAMEAFHKGVLPQAADVASKTTTGSILNTIKDFALDNKLLVGLAAGTLGMGALMGNMEEDEIQDLQRGEGLDIEGIRTEVIEAMKDSSGEKLKAIRIKYPFLGTRESKNQAAMAMGGRIGFNMGGGFSPNDLLLLKKFKMNPKEVATYKDGGAELLKSLRTTYIPKAEGGLMDLGGMEKDYRAEGGFVPIGAEEKADDVPARLSVNEFVFTADAVRGAGQGDIDKGAEIMENVMKNLEQGGQLSEESQGMQGARDMFQTSQRLGDIV